jgi:hypothetical protein
MGVSRNDTSPLLRMLDHTPAGPITTGVIIACLEHAAGRERRTRWRPAHPVPTAVDANTAAAAKAPSQAQRGRRASGRVTVGATDGADRGSNWPPRLRRKSSARLGARMSLLCSRAVERDGDVQRRPTSGWAHNPHSPAESLDPIFEPDEP